MKIIFIYLFISLNAFASTIEDSISHFSTTLDEVTAVRSSFTTILSVDVLKQDIVTLTSNEKNEDAEVHGIHFKDEKTSLIKAFKFLFSRRGHFSRNDFIQPQIKFSEFPYLRSCNKVLCIVERVWGSERGIKVLWIMLRFGFNASEYAYEDGETLLSDELDDVIIALNLLPNPDTNNLSILGKNIPILGFKNITGNFVEPGESVLANSSIFIFSSLRKESSPDRIRAIFHEMGHLFSHQGDLTKLWTSISGWESGSSKCSVSLYGNTSLGEDFAETFVQYRIAPLRLKKNCINKYNFMKDFVFKSEYPAQIDFNVTSVISMEETLEPVLEAALPELDFYSKKFDHTKEIIAFSALNKSKSIKSLNVDLVGDDLKVEFIERDHTVSYPILLDLDTLSGENFKMFCNLKYEMFGLNAILSDCSFKNNNTDIKKYFSFKKNKLHLKLI